MLDIISTPFGYLMRFFYQWTNNYALSLLLFALAVKLVLTPLTVHQRKSAITQARLRPKEMAIKKRYAGRNDAEARVQMATELQAMYKEEHYSVAGGCLPLLIQLPIIIALYNIVRDPLTHISRLTADTLSAIQTKALELIKAGELAISGATAETAALTEIQMSAALKANPAAFAELVPADLVLPDFTLFGIDMSANPTLSFSLIIIFPLLAGAFQWLSSFIMTKMMPATNQASPTEEKSPEADAAERTMRNMNIVMPIMTVFIAFSLPAIMSLYWVYQSIIGIISTVIIYKLMPLPTYTAEEYAAIEEEMNRDYVPIPVPRASTSGAGRSLHHIDDDDDEAETEDGEVVEVSDYTEITDEAPDEKEEKNAHREESAPRVRYDKNGNPIRSLHYIDFDEDEENTENQDNTEN